MDAVVEGGAESGVGDMGHHGLEIGDTARGYADQALAEHEDERQVDLGGRARDVADQGDDAVGTGRAERFQVFFRVARFATGRPAIEGWFDVGP